MNSMSRKNKMFLMLVFIILNGCVSEEVQNTFPLYSEDIEDVLSNEKILWTIKKSDSFREGHKLYQLENENHKLISVVSSYGVNSIRSLNLTFFVKDPMINKSIKEPIHEEDWIDMFKLAGALYGNSKDYKKIYRKLNKYLVQRNSKKYGRAIWSERIDDMHIKVNLVPSVDNHDKYNLIGIDIMNTEAYEEYLKSLENSWKIYIKQNLKAEIIQAIKISDISLLNESEDKFKGLVIKGHLENFKVVKYEELPSKILNIKVLPYVKDYISADLIDKTGSKRVIVKLSSLKREELSLVRKHYITYYNDEDICVIDYSVLDN